MWYGLEKEKTEDNLSPETAYSISISEIKQSCEKNKTYFCDVFWSTSPGYTVILKKKQGAEQDMWYVGKKGGNRAIFASPWTEYKLEGQWCSTGGGYRGKKVKGTWRGHNRSECTRVYSFDLWIIKMYNLSKDILTRTKQLTGLCGILPEKEHFLVALCVWKGPTLLEVGQLLDLKIHQFQIRGRFCLLLYRLHHEKSTEKKIELKDFKEERKFYI